MRSLEDCSGTIDVILLKSAIAGYLSARILVRFVREISQRLVDLILRIIGLSPQQQTEPMDWYYLEQISGMEFTATRALLALCMFHVHYLCPFTDIS